MATTDSNSKTSASPATGVPQQQSQLASSNTQAPEQVEQIQPIVENQPTVVVAAAPVTPVPQIKEAIQTDDNDIKVFISDKEKPQLTRELYLGVARQIVSGQYKNSRIDDNIRARSNDLVQSYQLMQGSVGLCCAFFAWKIFTKKGKSQFDLPIFTLVAGLTGYSGYRYDTTSNQLQSYFRWENNKFKNINLVEYKKNPEFYLRYILEE